MQFFCCDGGRLGGEGGSLPTPLPANPRGPFIHSMTEPSLCKYVMRVCAPSVCAAGPEDTRGGAAAASAAQQAAHADALPAVRAEDFHAPLTEPPEALDAAALPPVFFAVAVSQVLHGAEMAALEEGSYGVGGSTVLFTGK